MSLLPFRLRQAAAFFEQPPPPKGPPPSGSWPGLLREAAAEIERLRAALKEIRFAVGSSTEAYHIARLALGDEQTAD